MELFLTNFYADPLLYIGYGFAAAAALAFVVFVAGVGGGISHLFTYSESAHHMARARTRALWGFFLLVFLFIVWQAVRWVGGLFAQ